MFMRILALVGLLAVGVVLAVGCSQEPSPSQASPTPVKTADVASAKTGAQLWAENCSRCHNFRQPQSFSEAQWHVIVHHMRFRANLTGEEARSITAFLQSNNQ